MERRRLPRTTYLQFETLLEFIERNDIIIGVTKKTQEDEETIAKLWKEFADYISVLEIGPVKTPDQWKKICIEWKANVKRKARLLKEEARAGGALGKTTELSNLEQRLLNLLLGGKKEPFYNERNQTEYKDFNEISTSSLSNDSFKVVDVHQIINQPDPIASSHFVPCSSQTAVAIKEERSDEVHEQNSEEETLQVSNRYNASRRRLPRTTYKQLETLLQFLEEFEKGRDGSSKDESFEDNLMRWRRFANHVNSLGYGPSKTAQQWRKISREWKSNVKRKIRSINEDAHLRRDGLPTKLNALEKRLVDLLNEQVLYKMNKTSHCENQEVQAPTSVKQEDLDECNTSQSNESVTVVETETVVPITHVDSQDLEKEMCNMVEDKEEHVPLNTYGVQMAQNSGISFKLRRLPRTTYKQFEKLLIFLEEHEILHRKRTVREGDIYAKLWRQFTTYVNSLGIGPIKTVQQWKRVTVEWKGNVRRKAREQCLPETSGRKRPTLNTLEKRLLDLLRRIHSSHKYNFPRHTQTKSPVLENISDNDVTTKTAPPSVTDDVFHRLVSTLNTYTVPSNTNETKSIEIVEDMQILSNTNLADALKAIGDGIREFTEAYKERTNVEKISAETKSIEAQALLLQAKTENIRAELEYKKYCDNVGK